MVLGAERIDVIKSIVENKRVGLVVNQTSILENSEQHLLDALLDEGVDVKKVFAPEHGFRGTADAGAEVADSKDRKTGIPIISIYGKNKKPTAAQLADLDILIFDIQDVGARFYTYISTMHYVMEACAENDKLCVVLDRPNPNDFVDGPVLQPGFESFVGMHPIPLLHGLTVCELAMMINGERWLESTPDSCQLIVVPMKNWRHGDPYWLPVKPSPNLPNDQSIRLYPSLCLFEATPVSVGRGTYYPFQVIGYPDARYGSFSFTPKSLPGFDTNPLQKDKTCYGIDLREQPFEGGFSLRFFLDFYNKWAGDKGKFISRPEWLDLLTGSKRMRQQLADGLSEEEIRASWQEELDAYKEKRKRYLLYQEAP
ncbi:DUF1343 domain-containing protein [Parabacteroides sp. OttesenSCG-928-N08]|nr:DUF1343 domain-containing protein [Parabacteroides sp. OttesenSCG-928-N08]